MSLLLNQRPSILKSFLAPYPRAFVFDHLSRIYELDQPTKFAIGDSLNDLEMFKNADISFAMANGHPAIKELADHVTVSNDEDGVSQALAMIKGTR